MANIEFLGMSTTFVFFSTQNIEIFQVNFIISKCALDNANHELGRPAWIPEEKVHWFHGHKYKWRQFLQTRLRMKIAK